MAFGSSLGLPLLCEVAIGAAGSLLTNQNVSQIATKIDSSCVSSGSQGNSSLEALNQKLSALAVADPALDPEIADLANVFNHVGADQSIPFGGSFLALSAFVAYFEG